MLENKKYNMIKAVSWYTIGNILIKSTSFFILPIFTRLMSVYDYGVYSTYIANMAILETILLCGLASTVKMAKYSGLNYNSYITSILFIPIFLAVLTNIVINIVFFWNTLILGMDRILWNYLLITIIFMSINSILSGKAVIDGKYKVFMGYSAIYTISNIGFSLILCYTVYREHETYMARVIGGCVAAGLSAIFLLFSNKKGNINIKYIKQGICWGIPLLFHAIAATLMAQSDRILIQKYDSYDAAGIYGIAVTIMGIPMVIVTSFENAWIPWFYEKLSKKEYKIITKLNNLYISSFAVIIAAFMLVSPEIIKIFTHSDYWDSVYSLTPLLLSVFAELLYLIPLNIEIYYKKTNKIAFITALAMVFNLVFDIICIIKINYIAAAYVTFAARYFLFLLHWIYKNKIDYNQIISKQVIFGTSLSLFILNIWMQFIKDKLLFRWTLCFLLGVFIILYLKKNKRLIGEMIGIKK